MAGRTVDASPPRTWGYIRVSTETQTVENQRFEIGRFCARQGLSVDGWVEETASGGKDPSKRKLGGLLRELRAGDLLVCSEISRLGRSLFMIMDILNLCMTRGVRVWTIKDNYRLGDDIQSKVLAFAFGLSAEIERNLIRQRTKEALARRRAEGAVLGRPKGARTRPDRLKLHGMGERVDSMLSSGMSKAAVARQLRVDRGTLLRWLVYTGRAETANAAFRERGVLCGPSRGPMGGGGAR